MKLINARNGICICLDAKVAISFVDRLLGLINPNNPRSLVLLTRFGIHTFFLKDSIDLIVLDHSDRIRIVKEGLKPYLLFFYHPKYQKILELPSGTIKNTDSRVNDKILFE